MASGKVKITLEMEYTLGPVGGNWTIAELLRRTRAEGTQAANRLVEIANSGTVGQNFRLSLVRVEEGIVVALKGDE